MKPLQEPRVFRVFVSHPEGTMPERSRLDKLHIGPKGGVQFLKVMDLDHMECDVFLEPGTYKLVWWQNRRAYNYWFKVTSSGDVVFTGKRWRFRRYSHEEG